MRLKIFLTIISAVVSIAVAAAETKVVEDNESGIEVLLMPEIPSTLTSTTDRAGYLIEHFWDNMDFSDGNYARNEKFLEQNVVNFLSVMQMADINEQKKAIVAMYERSAVDSLSLQLVDELVETYLYGYDSPMYDEEMFLHFVDARLSSSLFDEDSKERDRMLRESILKNRKGAIATDFKFVTSDGGESTLRKAVAEADKSILIFYDPECEDCHRAIAEIKNSPILSTLNVIAVYDGVEADVWERGLRSMPKDWTVGMTNESVEESSSYDFPATPTIFLLGKDGIVLLKNTNVDKLKASVEN